MKASVGPLPLAIAASTSREVVTWMVSETLCVWSHCPPGRCSTKPRSVCTGPPRSTGWAAMTSVDGSSFICESTSERRIGRGLLRTMPRAPRSVCSQTSATVCAKIGSRREGIAIRRWLVRPPPFHGSPPVDEPKGDSPPAAALSLLCSSPMDTSMRAEPSWLKERSSGRRAHRAGSHPAADELPLVHEAQHPVAMRELRRERVEGTGEAQYGERRLVELRIAARAADRGALQMSVRVDGHLDDRARIGAGMPRRRGKV